MAYGFCTIHGIWYMVYWPYMEYMVYLYTYTWIVDFYGKWVGKYTSPMDPSCGNGIYKHWKKKVMRVILVLELEKSGGGLEARFCLSDCSMLDISLGGKWQDMCNNCCRILSSIRLIWYFKFYWWLSDSFRRFQLHNLHDLTLSNVKAILDEHGQKELVVYRGFIIGFMRFHIMSAPQKKTSKAQSFQLYRVHQKSDASCLHPQGCIDGFQFNCIVQSPESSVRSNAPNCQRSICLTKTVCLAEASFVCFS